MTEKSSFIPSCVEKISVLNSVKVHFKILGCMPSDNRNWPKWCKRIPSKYMHFVHIGSIFVILILNLVSTFWFYIREVDSLIDFSESVFWGSRSVLSLLLYTMFIWYKNDLIKILNNLEEMVNKSKLRRFSTLLKQLIFLLCRNLKK